MHHLKIVGGSGPINHSRIKVCLGPRVLLGAAKGTCVDNDAVRVQVGNDPEFQELAAVNGPGWRDLPVQTDATSIYALLDSPSTGRPCTLEWWFATDQPLNDVAFAVLANNDRGLDELAVESFRVRQE